MAVGTEFYQRLNALIKPESIPGNLVIIEDGADQLLAKLFFADAVLQKSGSGEQGFAYLRIILGQELGFGIGGTDGIKLILNPNPEGAGTSFPISFKYAWEVLKYKSNFKLAGFDNTVAGIFDIFKDIAQISDEEFINGVLGTFLGGDDIIGQFSVLFNNYNAGSYQLNLTNGISSAESILEILEKFDQQDVDFFKVVFDLFFADDFSLDVFWDRLKRLLNRWLDQIDSDRLVEIITPKFNLKLESLNAAIEFPDNILKPIDPEIPKSLLTFNIGTLEIDSKFGFDFQSIGDLLFTDSEIASSGFTLSFNDAKLDLSRNTNIPEATLDGRPDDFIGIYIKDGTIGFPAFWNHDDSNSTGQIRARNLLVGTGGISGTLGLEAKTAGLPSPLIKAKFGQGFEVSLDAFDITFQQNAIIGSNILGTLKIPNFEDAAGNPAVINIDVHIGQDGDFSVTAREADGIELCIPNVLKFILKSASIGRAEDRFFLSVSGALSFDQGSSIMAQIIPSAIEFQEIIIWDDGQFEIKGGSLELPQAKTLNYPPVELSVTAIHLGSAEREYNFVGEKVLRKYKYFGFDGAVKVDPGGVEAKGKGIQVYFSSDNSVMPLDMFIRIESIAIDLVFPGDVDPKDSALLISGFLSMKEPPEGIPGTEYAGGISFDLPKAGIGGAAAMRFNPKVPYFIVDAEVELSKAIPLGSTGLGIYGFRGLIGKHFVATKNSAGVAEEEPWWKYYKAKVADDYKEGVQISKFDPVGGFALGLGVSLATSTDSGKVFSSKIFLLLSLRELIMLQGQAAILSERIKLSDPNDPPFFALIVITKNSIEAALGVNYLVPDDKRPGSIATVQGVLELGFFFRDASAWYLNIGRDLPESYRIQVRLLELFDAYFYFMLSGKGIRAGAGASFDFHKKFGPLEARLYAYLDVAGKIAYKPKQIGGSIQLGGGVELSIFGFGFGLSVEASLAAESPEPFIVTGGLKACVVVLKKERCAKFEFTWTKNESIDTSEVGVIDRSDIGGSAQALNIQTKAAFPLNFVTESSGLIYRGATDPGAWLPPNPNSSDWNGSFNDYIIPLDSFIDIDFKNGLNPNGGTSTDKFGKSGGANHIQFVPPQKGKTPRVQHIFQVEDIYIYAWNPDTSGWEEYDIYGALTPLVDLEFIDPLDIIGLKAGYWQMESPNKYNKLRVMAQTPLSYMTEASGEYIPENSGITSESIFCEEAQREKSCVHFDNYPVNPEAVSPIVNFVNWNELYFFEKFAFKLKGINKSTVIKNTGLSHLGHNVALIIENGQSLEVTFTEPMAEVDFILSTTALSITIEYYKFVVEPTVDDPLNVVEYKLEYEDTFTAVQLAEEQGYSDGANPIDKLIIITNECSQTGQGQLTCDSEITDQAKQLEVFLDTLAINNQLTTSSFNILPTNEPLYDGAFLNTILYNEDKKPNQVSYTITSLGGKKLKFTVADLYGYSCNFELNSQNNIDWTKVRRLKNLRPDPSNLVNGVNSLFLIDAEMHPSGTVTLTGTTSCYTITNCGYQCQTALYTMCVRSSEDYFYNLTIPSETEVSDEVDTMVDALEKTFQPIWRPNTKFAIAIKTNEAASGGGSANHRNTFYYGFQTKGPVGHFHNYLEGGVETIRADYQQLLDTNQEDSYQLSTLKHYIDYRRSYPNADGDLLNAKPLFYNDPRLLVFYKKQYMFSMFGNWDVYAGNNAINGSLDVVIQDAILPETDPVATPLWALDAFAITDTDVLALNAMIANSAVSDCPPDNEIDQNGVNSVVDIDQLKPLKLYTAIFSNSYQHDDTDPDSNITREVHRYPFRTSRYGSFTEQVLSYQLLVDEIDPSTVLKAALFNHQKAILASDVAIAASILSGGEELIIDYADYFERILQGALKLGTLQPAVTNEFNKVYNSNTNTILGIWVRCPEPFNDPKLPKAEMESSIRLSVDAGAETDYKAIFSKDCREVFITKTDNSLNMPSGAYAFTFEYKEWNGNAYEVMISTPVNVNI